MCLYVELESKTNVVDKQMTMSTQLSAIFCLFIHMGLHLFPEMSFNVNIHFQLNSNVVFVNLSY